MNKIITIAAVCLISAVSLASSSSGSEERASSHVYRLNAKTDSLVYIGRAHV